MVDRHPAEGPDDTLPDPRRSVGSRRGRAVSAGSVSAGSVSAGSVSAGPRAERRWPIGARPSLAGTELPRTLEAPALWALAEWLRTLETAAFGPRTASGRSNVGLDRARLVRARPLGPRPVRAWFPPARLAATGVLVPRLVSTVRQFSFQSLGDRRDAANVQSARRQRCPSRVSSTSTPRAASATRNRSDAAQSRAVRAAARSSSNFSNSGSSDSFRCGRNPKDTIQITNEGRGASRVGGRERSRVDPPIELPDQVEQGRQCWGNVEIVIQGRLESGSRAVQQPQQRGIVRALGAVGSRARRRGRPASPPPSWPPPASPRRTRAACGSGPI